MYLVPPNYLNFDLCFSGNTKIIEAGAIICLSVCKSSGTCIAVVVILVPTPLRVILYVELF